MSEVSALEAEGGSLPVVPHLKISAAGQPYLEGTVCMACDTMHIGQRLACSKCGERERLATRALAHRGTLHTYSIVHRSFPGVTVPFVSAVVDLEGGGCIKGNLIDVPPDPGSIAFGMPVEVVFGDALGRKDREGRAYWSYFFRPLVPDASAGGSR